MEEATGLAAAGRVADAVDVLQAQVEISASAREQFLRRLAFAEFCASNGVVPLAEASYRRLLRQVEERGLETWESSRLLARVFEGVYHRALSSPTDSAELAATALEKLRLLDPRRSLESAP